MDIIKRISKEALDFWGYELQSTMAVEEMSELIKALCKYKRYGYPNDNKELTDNILEEIADVHNMIEQLEMFFGEDKIKEIRVAKLKRTQERIKKQKENE